MFGGRFWLGVLVGLLLSRVLSGLKIDLDRVARPGARIVIGDETVAPDGPVRSLLSRTALALVPRLRPPLEMIPAGDARATLVAGGLIYVIDWRKPGQPQ